MTEIKLLQDKNANKKRLYYFIEIIIFILLMWFYASHSLLLPNLSRPYSDSVVYRLQTNALLQGNLILSPHPFGAWHDFLWSEHGMSQNWGLGVPLLRIPFEWAAQQCGLGPFPDKFIVLFYLALMIVTFNVSLRLILMPLGLASQSAIGLLMRWYFISWVLFCPVIINLITKVDFRVYEEVIFYGYIYSCILFSTFWIYIRKPSDKTFIALCLVSGFACLIRPTLIFYGFTTALLAIVYLYQNARNIRLILLGIVCFCLGVFVDLWFNYARFGSIFEFGYSVNLSTMPQNDYGLRFFDYPFRREPFFSATKELLGDLFFNHLWGSSTFRCREYGFILFNILYLTALVGGSILFVVLSSFSFLKQRMFYNKIGDFSKIILFSLTWGLICFGFLFTFYLRVPYMTARYLCDFAAALNVILIVLLLLGISWLNSHYNWRKNKKFLISFIVITGALFCICNKTLFFNHASLINRNNTDKEGVLGIVDSFDQGTLLNQNLPETFYCGHSYSFPGLYSQFAGWDISKDCLVAESSTIYLPAEKCLVLNYYIVNQKRWPVIQVKRNITFLKLTGSAIVDDAHETPHQKNIMQRFCSDSFPANTVALYTIGWVTADKVGGNNPPIVLNWVSVSDENDLLANKK